MHASPKKPQLAPCASPGISFAWYLQVLLRQFSNRDVVCFSVIRLSKALCMKCKVGCWKSERRKLPEMIFQYWNLLVDEGIHRRAEGLILPDVFLATPFYPLVYLHYIDLNLRTKIADQSLKNSCIAAGTGCCLSRFLILLFKPNTAALRCGLIVHFMLGHSTHWQQRESVAATSRPGLQASASDGPDNLSLLE